MEESKAYVASQFLAKTRSGENVNVYTLQGAGGVRMDVINLGGKVTRVFLPDREGKTADCVLGFNDVEGYEASDTYFGTLVGRFGNRIAGGKFTLNGVEYKLAQNNAPGGLPCCLHGGVKGWDSKVWKPLPFQEGDTVGIIFTTESPDGEEGFPGAVKVKVTYTLTPDNVWRIEYEAVPDKDTPINMTQHVYFNLRGEGNGTVLDHELTLFCDRYTPTDPGLIPTGELASVKGTPFDFTTPHKIGERIGEENEQLKYGKGYDHNFVLASPSQDGAPVKAAALYEPESGRYLEVWTSEPGIQVYTGNYLGPHIIAKNGTPLSENGGVAMETQHFPDSPNKPQFPTTITKAGETYRSVTEYRFGVK